MERTRWYKNKVFIRSGPGALPMGTATASAILRSLRKARLHQVLGMDGIWFSPLYPSPNADCGYDISDYMDIHPEYGDLALFTKVLDGAHARDMKVLMDLVVNHTSDEHPGFKEPEKDRPLHGLLHLAAGKARRRSPNNWDSMFEAGPGSGTTCGANIICTSLP